MYTFNFKYVNRNVKFKMSSAEIVILPLHYNALDHVQESCIHLKHTTKSGNQKKKKDNFEFLLVPKNTGYFTQSRRGFQNLSAKAP